MPELFEEACKHHDVLEARMGEKMNKLDCRDTTRECQQMSRKRFWSVALACIGTIVGGYLWGVVQLGNCATEDEMAEIRKMIQDSLRISHEALTTVQIQAKMVNAYIERTEDRDGDQDTRIRNLEDARIREHGGP